MGVAWEITDISHEMDKRVAGMRYVVLFSGAEE